MALIGDIVALNGDRWVVCEFINNAFGTQDARLIRDLSHGRQRSILKNANFLTVVETPVFEIGERVRISKEAGTVQSIEGDIVNVLMDEREHVFNRERSLPAPQRREQKIVVEPGITRIAKWELVLENRSI